MWSGLGARREYFLLRLDYCSGDEQLARSVNGFCRHGSEFLVGNKELRLKALALDFTQEVARCKVIRLGVEPPNSSLGVAVPRDIDGGAVIALKRNDSRVLARQTSPVVAESAVVLNAVAEKTRVHVRVEDGRSVAGELGDGALGAPADEHVAAGQDLSAALGLGQQIVRWEVSADEVGGPGLGVEFQDLSAAGRRGVDF